MRCRQNRTWGLHSRRHLRSKGSDDQPPESFLSILLVFSDCLLCLQVGCINRYGFSSGVYFSINTPFIPDWGNSVSGDTGESGAPSSSASTSCRCLNE
jgi:hypothetical protein